MTLEDDLRSSTVAAGLVALGLFVSSACTPDEEAALTALGLDPGVVAQNPDLATPIRVVLPTEQPMPTTTTTLPPSPEPAPQPAAQPSVALVPSDDALAALRWCEATGNYAAVSPGGWYRGAYQFDQTTWNGVASRHYPHLVGADPAAASPADQDAMARALYSERGAQPWPWCGYTLG